MQKKLTITIGDDLYEGLCNRISPRKISTFIEQRVRPHVIVKEREHAHKAMSRDEARKTRAMQWTDAMFEDGSE